MRDRLCPCTVVLGIVGVYNPFLSMSFSVILLVAKMSTKDCTKDDLSITTYGPPPPPPRRKLLELPDETEQPIQIPAHEINEDIGKAHSTPNPVFGDRGAITPGRPPKRSHSCTDDANEDASTKRKRIDNGR